MAIDRELKTMSEVHFFFFEVHFLRYCVMVAELMKNSASLFDALRLSTFRKKYRSAWEDVNKSDQS